MFEFHGCIIISSYGNKKKKNEIDNEESVVDGLPHPTERETNACTVMVNLDDCYAKKQFPQIITEMVMSLSCTTSHHCGRWVNT